eukprot:Skav208894  [mRNA]  locus=scaffold270:457651:472536:- [translate_table: standard]
MEDAPRDKLLDGLSQPLGRCPALVGLGQWKNLLVGPTPLSQLTDVARACNRFPAISLEYKACRALDKDEEGATVGPVYAMYYPKVRAVTRDFSEEKEESWWLVIGGPKSALVSNVDQQSSAAFDPGSRMAEDLLDEMKFDAELEGFFNGTTNTVNLQPQATSFGSEDPTVKPSW